MRREFKRRVNLFQLHYRAKKFDEPLPINEALDDISDADSTTQREREVWRSLGGKDAIARLKRIEENNRKGMLVVDRLLKKKEVDKISDLESVHESDEDVEWTSKEQCA